MTKQEFQAIVAESMQNGASRQQAEDYVIAGYKIASDIAKVLRAGKSAVKTAKAAAKTKKRPMKR